MNGDEMRSSSGDRAAVAAESALAALIEQPVPPLPRAEAKELEQRIALRVEALAAQARERRGRRARALRGLAVGAAVAAALAAALGGVVVLRSRPTATVAQVSVVKGSIEIASGTKTRSPPLLALEPLAEDEEIRTGEGSVARASLATGAVVEIGPSARVSFASRGRRPADFDSVVALARGRVSLDVPPLPMGATLSVRTPTATVTVHGTRFSVEQTVAPTGEPDETRVAVEEGRVAVHAGAVERFLVRGQVWSSRDAEGPAGGGAPETPPPGAAPTGAPAGSAAREPARAPARTTLTAENELLQAALEARRRGQPRLALESLDRLLKRYPGSPLVEIARVERKAALEMLARDAGGTGR